MTANGLEAAPARTEAQADGPGAVLRLAWPLIVSNSFWMLQILADRIILSRAGGDAVGAGFMAAMIFWAPLSLFQHTAGYAVTFVAQYTGAGRPERTGPAAWQGLHLASLAGLGFWLLAPVADPIFTLIGHEPHLQELEAIYFRCLCYAALPVLWTAAAGGFFAGRGDSRTVMVVNSIGLAVNVAVALLLVPGWWGLPRYGIIGAGWAMIAGSSVSAALALALLLRPANRPLGVWSGWRFEPDLFRRLVRYGLPNGLLVGLDMVAWSAFVALVGRMGPAPLTATTIAVTLNLIVVMPSLGIAEAVAVLVGQRQGEGRPDRAARATHAGLRLALGLTAATCLLYLLAPDALAGLFRGDQSDAEWRPVAELVTRLLRFVVAYCLFDCLNLVYSHALRGAGDTRFVTAVAVALAWPVMVAPTWAAWRHGWGLYWAWAFATVYILLLAGAFWLRFRHGAWRSMRVIEAAPAA